MKIFEQYEKNFGPGFKDASRHLRRAVEFQKLNRESEMISAVEAAFRKFPETAPLELYLGVNLPPENSARIFPVMEKIIRTNPARAAWAYVLRAEIFSSPTFQDRKRAVEDLEWASRLNPRAAWIHAHKARALELAGRREDAAAALDCAAHLSPKCGWILAWRGALRLKAGLWKKALHDLNRAVRLNPRYHAARLWRSQALMRAGKFKAACRDLEDAMRLQPEVQTGSSVYDRVYAELGQLFRKQQAWPRAARAYIKAFERDTKYGWVPPQSPQECAALLPELDRAAAAFPRDPAIAAWRVLCLAAMGLTAEAERSESQLSADEAFFCFARARLEEARGRFPEALRKLNRAIQLKPSAAYHQARGFFLSRRGRAAQAWKDLNRALKNHAPSAPLLYELSEVSSMLGKNEQAAQYLMKALQWDSRLPPLGREESALKLSSRLIRIFPRSRELRLFRAGIYKRLERPEEALIDWNALVRKFPRESALRVERSLLRRLALDFKGALEDAREAVRLDPDHLEARCALSEALRGLGHLPQAQKEARAAIKRHPKADHPRLVYAKALRQSGALNAALRQVFAARRLNPNNAKAWAWNGEILRKAGHPRKALAAFRRALALNSNLAWAWMIQGETLGELGRLQEAQESIRKALTIERAAGFAQDFLGAETKRVRWDKAHAWIYAWRGAVRYKLGAYASAVRDFNHALALNPECLWARAWKDLSKNAQR